MYEQIRILHVLGRLDRGGAETMIMNLYRNIDRTKIQFDFIVHTNDKCDYDDEIEELGGKIFRVPRYTGKNHFIYKKIWIEFLKNNTQYNIIHGHIRSTAIIYLSIAKKRGLIAIAHSHSIASRGNKFEQLVKSIMQFSIRYKADYLFACSEEAGIWLFGKRATKKDNFRVLKNAIDVSKFLFDASVREKIRKRLGIESKYVIGHVGSFTHPKNHIFLLKIFYELKKQNKDVVLLLVGDGELRQEIIDNIESLKMSKNVILVGNKSNVNDYYQAMDFFVLPSLFEGLPIVSIEAQTSGLKCLISDTVSKEIEITDLVSFDDIKKPAYEWAMRIFNERGYKRLNVYDEIVKAGFNVLDEAKIIQNFYLYEII